MRHLASGAILAALLAAGPLARADERTSPVVLGVVVEKEVHQGRSFVGTVEPVRSGEVDVQASGYVEALLVEEGDHVAEGAELARLRLTTLEIRLKAARAELELRRQSLLELQNGSRAEDKEAAAARVEEAQAEEEAAAWKLEAVRKLREQDQISEEDLREAVRARATARARLRALQAALALVVEGPRPERIAQAQSSLDVQQAAVDQLEDEKERHVIRAPFAGVVTKKRTEVGAWLNTGGAVVDLIGLDEVDVVVQVIEDAVAFLQRGMPVQVTIDALPEPHLRGTIHRIVPVSDRRARTVPVKVRLQNVQRGEEALIKAGMFARVNLAVGEPRKALFVPKDAVVLGGRSPVVYVYDAESKGATPVPVTLGVAVEDLIEVEGDVQAGQQIVVRGNERIFPGTKVRPVEDR